MITLTGKNVSDGTATGNILFYKRRENLVKCRYIEDTKKEKKRFDDARESVIRQLQQIYETAVKEVGKKQADVFDVHQMIVADVEFQKSVHQIIKIRKVNAEYAVEATVNDFTARLEAMDTYMQERVMDIQDVSNRLIEVLSGREQLTMEIKEPVIIVADDLAPSETIRLDKEKVLGFVTMHGSMHSHTAIFARTMNIPAIVGVGEHCLEEYDGKQAVLIADEGTLYIDPKGDVLKNVKKKQKAMQEERLLLSQYKGKESRTKKGQKMLVSANIGKCEDVVLVTENDADGIGLLRSEFLYMEQDTFPSEEDQFKAYKKVAKEMKGKKVIIRTLDIGADKQVNYFGLSREENPAMGCRAIRICLKNPEVFKTQLRAIYRASAFGQIAVMFPMIISGKEVQRIKKIIEELKTELRREKKPFDEALEIGIMIETPAAVMISEELAKEVDFFSIGTNDLTQYTLAIDRQNEELEEFYDAHHPAILSMIRMTVEHAHKHGIWVGVCGELAADMTLTEEFLKMGIEELSVAPRMILPLRKRIREQ